MRCEVNVIVVIEVDNDEEAQEAATQIMHAAQSAHPTATGFGANWTTKPELFVADYGDEDVTA